MTQIQLSSLTKAFIATLLLFSVIACSNSPSTHIGEACFNSQEEARAAGNSVNITQFSRQVRVMVDGQDESIPGLGLQWYPVPTTHGCGQNKYPLTIIYEPDEYSDLPRERVKEVAQWTLNRLVR